MYVALLACHLFLCTEKLVFKKEFQLHYFSSVTFHHDRRDVLFISYKGLGWVVKHQFLINNLCVCKMHYCLFEGKKKSVQYWSFLGKICNSNVKCYNTDYLKGETGRGSFEDSDQIYAKRCTCRFVYLIGCHSADEVDIFQLLEQ